MPAGGMLRMLQRSMILIDEPSSPIGRAAALTFARRGADLVLPPEAPSSLVEECERFGSRVRSLATAGGVDVCVVESGDEDFVRERLRLLSPRRRGVFIHVGSLSDGARPLGAKIRRELEEAGHRTVRFCTLLAASAATPEQVAEAAAFLARHPRREMFIGRTGRILILADGRRIRGLWLREYGVRRIVVPGLLTAAAAIGLRLLRRGGRASAPSAESEGGARTESGDAPAA